MTDKRKIGDFVRVADLYGEDEFLSLSRPVKTEAPAFSKSGGDSLEALQRDYAGCLRCPLGNTRNKIVFGMGSLHPKVLFVGEGPGYEEDRQGLPFVGKAGQLLDKMLAAIGLDRQTVYIANIVKCHPLKDPAHPEMRGNDRPPLPEEMQACREILNRQIEILQPPLLCALGATAAKALLGTDAGITRLRGRQFDFEYPVSSKTVPLIPTYHPAALLRNPDLKKDAWTDLKLLRRLLDGLFPPQG